MQNYFHLVEIGMILAILKQSPLATRRKPDWWCFYGGDIEGVRQKIALSKNLGVNLPLFKSAVASQIQS